MRALQVTKYGDLSSLQVAEIDERSPRPAEIKLRVTAVGVGYFDALLVRGDYQIKPPLPFVPGSSIAGVVEEVGDKVQHISVGDHVAAFALTGGLAEKATLPSNSALVLPPGIALDDAANFFVAYATGVLGLVEIAQVASSETVLILGASGTTGSTAIEIAKASGARVIACASTDKKRARCLAHGADEVVDYTASDWRKAVKALAPKGVDIVYDPIGGAFAEPALRCLAPGGRYLVVGFVAGIAEMPLNLTLLKRCSIHGVNWGGSAMGDPTIVPKVMTKVIEWAVAGKLKTTPDQAFDLAESGEAFESLFGRSSIGKIVIRP